MPYFAVFDKEGKPSAFYHSDVHGARTRPIKQVVLPKSVRELPREVIIGEEPNPDCVIPAEAVEISDEEWMGYQNA